MRAHLSAPPLNVASIVGPVGNSALQAVGIAHEQRQRPGTSLMLCFMGEGSTQKGEVMEAIPEAACEKLRVLLPVHVNGWAISTPTHGRTFLLRADGPGSYWPG